MKKYVISLSLILLSLAYVIAADFNNLLFMTGIGSKIGNSDSDHLSLSDQVGAMGKYYTSAGANVVIVGQSQGGVRALGCASTYPAKTAAVITIGSPVKGYPALATPQTTMNSIDNAVNTITGGLAACVPVLGDIAAAGFLIGTQSSSITDAIIKAVRLDKNEDKNIAGIANLVLNAGYREVPGITDLSPNSAFMTGAIYPAEHVVTRPVKQLIGYSPVYRYESRRVRFWWWSWTVNVRIFVRFDPIYKIYNVFDHMEVVKKIPDSTYVAFVRGTQNDPLTFLSDDQRATATRIMEAYKDVTYRAYMNSTAVSSLSFIGGCVSLGFSQSIWAIRLFFNSALFASYGTRALDGYRWVNDYKANFGTLLGDTNNDGFIPYNAQSWDVAELGGRALNGDQYVKDFVDNHNTELTDPAIWGANGGGMDNALVTRDTNIPEQPISYLYSAMDFLRRQNIMVSNPVNSYHSPQGIAR